MASSITLRDELYNQVVKRARAANTTPEEWVDETLGQRLRREDASARLNTLSEKNSKDMAHLGVKPSDIDREIADYRHGR